MPPYRDLSAKKGPEYAASDVNLTWDIARRSVLQERTMPDKKLKLVMVDDDAAIVRIVEHIVAQHLPELFDTVAFTDSRRALDWINESACDVLISDLEMPGVSGLDLLRAGKRRHAELQAILLTAHSSWERIAEAIEQGVDDYLLKPIDRVQFVDLLQQKHRSLSPLPAEAYKALNGTAIRCASVAPISR
jgi:two-component system response regulator YesN